MSEDGGFVGGVARTRPASFVRNYGGTGEYPKVTRTGVKDPSSGVPQTPEDLSETPESEAQLLRRELARTIKDPAELEREVQRLMTRDRTAS